MLALAWKTRWRMHSTCHAALWGAGIFLLGLPLSYLLHTLHPAGTLGAESYIAQQSSHSLTFFVIVALGFAPWVEAAIAQWLPIELMRKFRIPTIAIVIVCGLVFGGGHYSTNGINHALKTGIDGMIYGVLYLRVRDRSAAHSWFTVAFAHFINNLCALAVVLVVGQP